MAADRLLPTRPGHQTAVQGTGWGEPPTYYTHCTCGWHGITIQARYYPTPEAEANAMVEPYRSIARTYGPEALLPDNTAYGTREDAIVQALTHLGYDPDQDHRQVLADLHDATVNLQAALTAPGTTLDQVLDNSPHLQVALEQVAAAAARKHAWDHGTLPTLPDRHPEARRLVAAARTRKSPTTKEGPSS